MPIVVRMHDGRGLRAQAISVVDGSSLGVASSGSWFVVGLADVAAVEVGEVSVRVRPSGFAERGRWTFETTRPAAEGRPDLVLVAAS